MKIFLLTHERELRRATNTGCLAIENANNLVERILWERIKPNKDLIRLIENNEAALLYSKTDPLPESALTMSSEVTSAIPALTPLTIEEYENIIIIDATWQEAKKIFNQSPYLRSAPHFTLKTESSSLYKLRANQPTGGLCTIECIIEVLKLKGQNKKAAELVIKFDQFNG
ncbi:tRNA-uridine aminocarboxypropyltransferase [Cognaticolwellia beringensis]|uniref:tRNA-uridine aminocarboxypropyltransferase n=1 Tax=Cognaticolwellia beringensis TaxID=1967665 RepID=A0A222GC14_9GAMM|nr:tRNA-uridine aminocarboxypropyltransferase [Cognaticolwellia beringensis]ASP49428.1 DTW domain-containing protein [Cognaticolwellia beringensis]